MSDLAPGQPGRWERLAAQIERHPWLFGIGAGVITLVLLYGVSIGIDLGFPRLPRVYAAILTEGLSATLWIGVTWRLGWLTASGFTRPGLWRSRYLLWWVAPFGLLAWSATAYKPAVHTPLGIGATALLTVLVGLNEETLCRGLILRAFLRRGARRAIVSQALIFGLLHVTNLIGFDPRYVGFEVVVVMLLGVFLAALRLRVNAIWPAVAIHGLVDFGAFVSHGYSIGTTAPTLANMVGGIGVYGFLALVGILIARPSRINPQARAVQLSPDGYYIWQKGSWQPAQYSPDRGYVWDGGAWRLVPTALRPPGP